MKTKTPSAGRPPATTLRSSPAFAVTVDVMILTMVERTLNGWRGSGSSATRRRTSSALEQLLAAGEYRPVIDRTYRLEDVVEAHRYVETRQKTGNVVLSLNGGPR